MNNSVLILGAGISGLTAARYLRDREMNVVLVDKGRGVGGRVATRWKGTPDRIEGRWDHGAQFVSLRSRALKQHLADWGCLDLLESWMPGHSDPSIPRMRPKEGMNAFPKKLAEGLEIHRGQRILKIEQQENGWMAHSESGEIFQAAQMLSTIPMPQFLDLARQSSLSLLPGEFSCLSSVQYERCLTLLIELEGPSGLSQPGYLRVNSGILETISDQQLKGISNDPLLVAHATPAFSLEWYDRDRNAAASVLRAAVQEKISSRIRNVQIHGWKFAKPVQRIPENFLQLDNGILLAGDGFAAGDSEIPADLHPRIESAMLSGISAAKALLSLPTGH
ncbi:MAG: NAD(P)/FAD-dependent oxidoreductase [Kiritimatiellia bacterium]